MGGAERLGLVANGGAIVTWTIESPQSPIPISADEGADTLVVLAHGAGSHMDHKTMCWISDLVRRADTGVARFNFAYRALGKSMPDRMPVLTETYQSVITSIREKLSPEKLVIGGHSMGGRVASMLAAEGEKVDGLLLFGYPLHPPGKFDKLRDAHLPKIKCPTLQFSGTRDDFCSRELMEKVPVGANYEIFWVEGADHSYSIAKSSGKTRKDAETEIAVRISDWLGKNK